MDDSSRRPLAGVEPDPNPAAVGTDQPVAILLVNDRPAQLTAWQAILSRLGQALVLARSGDEALEHLLARDFAAILLDVNMPGLDGFETAELIRQHPRCEHTPILFVSAINTQDRDRTRGYALGAVDYIFTPVVPEVLQAKVGAFVDLHRKSRQVAQQADQLAALNQVLETQLDEIGKLNAELRQANTELDRSHEQLRRLTAHVEALREDERARIAREVHDDLGGALTGLKMDVARLRRSFNGGHPDRQNDFEQLNQSIDVLVQSVRRIATELRPAILDDFGLAAAIEWQLQEFTQRAGLHGELFLGDADLSLPPDTATALFRVFQEALTNVARHAQATQVAVTLHAVEQSLVLQVRDNGRGVTPDELRQARSFGLVGMRERVHLLRGELEINSQPGQGTTIQVRVPLTNA